MERKQEYLGAAFSAVIILAMIVVSLALGETDVIIPEVAALCLGVFLRPKLPWADTGPVKLLLLMTASAVFGLGLAQFVPLLFLRVVLGCVFSLFCLTIFRSGLYLMLSVCILPALLGITSWIYPVSVFLCTLTVILCRQLLGLFCKDGGLRTVETKTDYRSPEVLRQRMQACGILLAYALPACLLERPLMIAPPLFALFFTLYTDDKKMAGKEEKLLFGATLCCVTGAAVVLILQQRFGLDMLAACALIAVAVYVYVRYFELYLPPVAALAFLPLILPAEVLVLYPVYTGLSLILMILFIRKKRQNAAEADAE